MNQELRDELLERGLSDIIQLDEMISVASRYLSKPVDDREVMDDTFDVISHLVASGYAIIGDVVQNAEGLLEIRSWGLTPAETVKRIEDEWHALGRPPSLGEICWLELTEDGHSEARRVLWAHFTKTEYDLLHQLVATQVPERLPLLSVIGQRKLTDDERKALRGVISNELTKAGLDANDKLTDYGLLLHRIDLGLAVL